MRELAEHVTDLIENSVRAGARRVEVMVVEDLAADQLTLRVADDGCGMSAELMDRVADPFFTSRDCRRVGLGLPLLTAAAERCGGSLEIVSAPGNGTTVTARFFHGHIDRPPLGDMHCTLLAALVGHPEVDFLYRHRVNGATFEMDGAAIKRELGDVPLSHPSVLRWLERFLAEGLIEVGVVNATLPEEEGRNA